MASVIRTAAMLIASLMVRSFISSGGLGTLNMLSSLSISHRIRFMVRTASTG